MVRWHEKVRKLFRVDAREITKTTLELLISESEWKVVARVRECRHAIARVSTNIPLFNSRLLSPISGAVSAAVRLSITWKSMRGY